MTQRFPISLVRTALQMMPETSNSKIARQLSCSRASLVNWRKRFLTSGKSFVDLPSLDDDELCCILFSYKTPRGFFPWKGDHALWAEFCRWGLPVKQFYESVYLPMVPAGQVPVTIERIYYRIHVLRKRNPEMQPATTSVPDTDTVQCFDISDEAPPAQSAPLYRNQVRITLANGASIDFYPGSASEAFVGELLRQNGVKI